MAILNLQEAAENGKVSQGVVLINNPPMVRSGKKGDYMVGQFASAEGTYEFKIWEEEIFSVIQAYGTGLYDVEVIGAEFNGFYFTIRRAESYTDSAVSKYDFLPRIPREQINQQWKKTITRLRSLGVSEHCWQLVQQILADSELAGRFVIEGAAVFHHDNKIGGLVNHTTKMLNILAALLENNPELVECADLLAFSIVMHDIGKVFEYQDLAPAEFWYSNHRIRGIEFLSKYKDEIIDLYDEVFYRHVQSVIAGHHGEYGDRPTSVTAGIVHYIDTLESQTTGLIEAVLDCKTDRIRYTDWGFLEPLPIRQFKSPDEDSPEALESYFTNSMQHDSLEDEENDPE